MKKPGLVSVLCLTIILTGNLNKLTKETTGHFILNVKTSVIIFSARWWGAWPKSTDRLSQQFFKRFVTSSIWSHTKKGMVSQITMWIFLWLQMVIWWDIESKVASEKECLIILWEQWNGAKTHGMVEPIGKLWSRHPRGKKWWSLNVLSSSIKWA